MTEYRLTIAVRVRNSYSDHLIDFFSCWEIADRTAMVFSVIGSSAPSSAETVVPSVSARGCSRARSG